MLGIHRVWHILHNIPSPRTNDYAVPQLLALQIKAAMVFQVQGRLMRLLSAGRVFFLDFC